MGFGSLSCTCERDKAKTTRQSMRPHPLTSFLPFLPFLAGTSLHRSGGHAFQRAREPEPVQDVPGDLLALKRAVTRRGREYQMTRRAVSQQEKLRAEKFLEIARREAADLVQCSNTLEEMPGCSFAAMSLSSSCPTLVPLTTATDAVTSSAQDAVPLSRLGQAWRRRHWGVDAKKKEQQDRFWKPRPCYRNGVCTCGQAGAAVRQLWKKVQDFLKQRLGSKRPENLLHGHVVLCWRRHCRNAEQEHLLQFTGVPLHYLRPFRPTLLMMSPLPIPTIQKFGLDDELETQEALQHGRSHHGFLSLTVDDIDGVPTFFETRAFMKTLDLEYVWSLRVLLLSTRGALCRSPPGAVRVEVVGDEHQIWCGLEEIEKGGGMDAFDIFMQTKTRKSTRRVVPDLMQAEGPVEEAEAAGAEAASNEGEGADDGDDSDDEYDSDVILQFDNPLQSPREQASGTQRERAHAEDLSSDLLLSQELCREFLELLEVAEQGDVGAPAVQAAEPPEGDPGGDSSSSSSTSSSSSSTSTGTSSSPNAGADERPQVNREVRDYIAVFEGQVETQMRIRLKPSTSDMYTNCPWHHQCQRTRTLRQGRGLKGRPLGELASWALAGARFRTKAEHCQHQPSRESRVAARQDLKQNHNYEEFSRHERARFDNESSEPA